MPACCYKNVYTANVYTFGENYLAYFFCSFWGGNEKFAEIRAGSLSHLGASYACASIPRRLVHGRVTCTPGIEFASTFLNVNTSMERGTVRLIIVLHKEHNAVVTTRD